MAGPVDYGAPVVEMVVDPEILAQVQKETADKLKVLEADAGMAESEKAKIMEELKATDTKAEAVRRAKGLPFFMLLYIFLCIICMFKKE